MFPRRLSCSLPLLAAVGLLSLAGCKTCRYSEYSASRVGGPASCGCTSALPPGRLVPAPMMQPPLAGAPRPDGQFYAAPPQAAASDPNGTAPVTYLEPAPNRGGGNGGGGNGGGAAPDLRMRPPAQGGQPGTTREPPVANVPPAPPEEKPKPTDGDGGTAEKPKASSEPDAQSAIDLPGFAIARQGVATGIQPFPDGVTWLKNKGYKAVLHLRAPGEDNAAAKRQFESKGLKYASVEASPARLTVELYRDFVKAVDDKTTHPLFVYDRDGSVAGGLWFLYNRVHLKASQKQSLAEAQRLGLRPDEEGEHATMWLAVQTVLKKLIDEKK